MLHLGGERHQSARQAQRLVSVARNLPLSLPEMFPQMDHLQRSPPCQTLSLVTVHELRIETSFANKVVTAFFLFLFLRPTWNAVTIPGLLEASAPTPLLSLEAMDPTAVQKS